MICCTEQGTVGHTASAENQQAEIQYHNMIISGSANCICCSRLKPKPMPGWKITRVPLLLCCRSRFAHSAYSAYYTYVIFYIFCIFCILCILWSDSFQDGWMPASQPSSMSAVNQQHNQLKSCMVFQCPPYWGCLLSRWAILERSAPRDARWISWLSGRRLW
jgi:hypothetical protein